MAIELRQDWRDRSIIAFQIGRERERGREGDVEREQRERERERERRQGDGEGEREGVSERGSRMVSIINCNNWW